MIDDVIVRPDGAVTVPFFSIIVTGLPCRANSVTDAFSVSTSLCASEVSVIRAQVRSRKSVSALVGDGIAVGCAALIGFVHGIRQTGQNRRYERLGCRFRTQGR